MNKNIYSSQYTVPSLSLASSRTKRNIPTKDISGPVVQVKPRSQIMDRINRPPIFSSKNIRQSKVSVQSNSIYRQQNEVLTHNETPNLNRNVYLSRQEASSENQITFRSTNTDFAGSKVSLCRPPSGSLLRNPESTQNVGMEIQKRLQSKKIDINKSLFERKIKKLFQQAEFYDNQLSQMYPDNLEKMNKQLEELQSYRKETMSFKINSSLINII